MIERAEQYDPFCASLFARRLMAAPRMPITGCRELDSRNPRNGNAHAHAGAGAPRPQSFTGSASTDLRRMPCAGSNIIVGAFCTSCQGALGSLAETVQVPKCRFSATAIALCGSHVGATENSGDTNVGRRSRCPHAPGASVEP